ncbi:hypothetical protein HKCCE2091_03000 [Rhodobacterales bacterium HKCCE2091]|nr:hypothetical protein [Rhodobacterales bacterium HKCCE2091]
MKRSVLSGLAAFLLTTAGVMTPALAQDTAAGTDAGGAGDCTPLSEQYPDLGTEQSVSASRDFVTVWGSYELPGGPCGYESAAAHWEALVSSAQERGTYSTETPPEIMEQWAGSWGTENNTGEIAIVGRNSIREGMAARLTPEAREVFMSDSQLWLDDHAIDPISFCLQPNFPRSHTEYGYREFLFQPGRVALYSQMVNQLRHIYLDREHPSEEWLESSWLGSSIGFWDGDILNVYTVGVKEGILQRNMPRQTDQMETIERFRFVDPEGTEIPINTLGATPDPNARIEIELTMYDPTFVEPWHTVIAYYRELETNQEEREINWIHSWDCVEGSNWYMTENGVISQYAPGERPPITEPDFWFDANYVHQ